jgi:tRNA pseudouridine55 synthase
VNGLLVIDKPGGITSHDVVNRLRKITGEQSIGHLGTLDPMATGVLPLLMGKYTRLAQYFSAAEKSYTGTFALDSPPTPTMPKASRPDPTVAGNRAGRVTLEGCAPRPRGFIGEWSRCRRPSPLRRLPASPHTNWRARASRSS